MKSRFETLDLPKTNFARLGWGFGNERHSWTSAKVFERHEHTFIIFLSSILRLIAFDFQKTSSKSPKSRRKFQQPVTNSLRFKMFALLPWGLTKLNAPLHCRLNIWEKIEKKIALWKKSEMKVKRNDYLSFCALHLFTFSFEHAKIYL